MTGIHTESSHSSPVHASTPIFVPGLSKGKVKYLSPSNKIAFFPKCIASTYAPASALTFPSFQNCLSGFVCLPVTDAVRVQLYRIASSPNTFPGPMVHNFLPCLVISTVPSVHKHQKTFQWIPRFWSEGNAVNGKVVCEGGERRTIVNDSFNGAGGFGGISMMLQCRCSGERLAVLET